MATFEVTLKPADEEYVRERAEQLGLTVSEAVALVVEERRCEHPGAEAPEEGHVRPGSPLAGLIGLIDDPTATDLSTTYKSVLYGPRDG